MLVFFVIFASMTVCLAVGDEIDSYWLKDIEGVRRESDSHKGLGESDRTQRVRRNSGVK